MSVVVGEQMRLGLIVPAAALLALSGCGVADQIDANRAMVRSLANYKTCLAQHPQDAPPCEAARLTYEADQNNAGRHRDVVN
jgi:hypothetical protein